MGGASHLWAGLHEDDRSRSIRSEQKLNWFKTCETSSACRHESGGVSQHKRLKHVESVRTPRKQECWFRRSWSDLKAHRLWFDFTPSSKSSTFCLNKRAKNNVPVPGTQSNITRTKLSVLLDVDRVLQQKAQKANERRATSSGRQTGTADPELCGFFPV